MGDRGMASSRSHGGKTRQHAKESGLPRFREPRALAVRDWSVSWRLSR